MGDHRSKSSDSRRHQGKPGGGTIPAGKVAGRKRNIITDTLGILAAVLVTAAGVSDSAVGLELLTDVAA